jgi:hypothetical protein
MSSDRHARRFDPRWLLPATGTDGTVRFGTHDASAPVPSEPSTNDGDGRDVDEAIKQISSEGCTVCPLCGAIVARDGSLLG